MRRIAPLAATALLAWTGTAAAQGVLDAFVPPAFQNVVLRNSFNPSGAGARGLGMGGAFIAVADDGTAASFNPAGLSQLRRSELAFVGFADRLESTTTLRGAPFSDLTRNHGALDFAGLAVPFDVGGKNLTVQLSYQRSVDLFGEGDALILGGAVLDDDLVLFRGGVNAEQKGAFHTISLSTAYQVTQRLSLGATLNYWIADWKVTGTSDFQLSLPELGIDFTPVEAKSFNQDQDYRALNVNFGVLLKYPKVSFGAVLRLPFGSEYDLHETGRRQDLLDETSTPIDNKMRTTLHWPMSAGAGIALRPIKGLTLAGDYTTTQWSRTYLESVPGGFLGTPTTVDADGNTVDTFVDRNFFDLEPASITATVNTSIWRVGGEYLIVTPGVVIPLRGGYFKDKSPVPQFQGEFRRIEGFTVGTGLNFDRVVLDFAYEHRKSSGDVGIGLGLLGDAEPPFENVKEQRLVASVIYRFGSAGGEDPLKKFFHDLFSGSKD